MFVPDRQQVFEFVAFWLGGTTASEVASMLGVRRQFAQTSIVAAYKKRFPGVMRKCPKTKVTIFGDQAAALKLSPCTMADVLAVTDGLRALQVASGGKPSIQVPYEDTFMYFDNEPADEHFRTLYEAIGRRRTVTLDYQSKRTHFSTVFSPHAFVRSPFRIHVRGWSQMQEGMAGRYMDLVPARIVRSRISGPSGYVDERGDSEWHSRVTVRAEMLEDLTAAVKAAVTQEFLPGGQTFFEVRNVRQASVRYVVEGIMNRRVGKHDGPLWSVTVGGKPYVRD